MNYGVPIVSYLQKSNRDISRAHCIAKFRSTSSVKSFQEMYSPNCGALVNEIVTAFFIQQQATICFDY